MNMLNSRVEPGAPVADGMIPLCVPEVRGNEWMYVKECLDSGWVSSVGPFVDRFERELAARVGAPYGVATVNGTAALQISLLVAGVQANDEVLVSALTFIAPANAIRYAGAYPVFIDAEPEYWQMDPERVREFLEEECTWQNSELRNRETGRRVRAILPVHILGHPVDLAPIVELARKYDLVVVEDATEALGTRYKGEPVGAAGDIACFSFNGNKLITTGGGGMIVTPNAQWASNAKYLTTQAKDDPVEYIHGETGYNYRLTNVLAAMGCAQLEKLDEYIGAKRRVAEFYEETLGHVPGITPMHEAPWAFSTFWMYTVIVDERRYGIDSRSLLRNLAAAGIQTRPLWQPLHQSRVFRDLPQISAPVSEYLNRVALSLPCSVGIAQEQLWRVASCIAENATER
jgi:perosamine synthetase